MRHTSFPLNSASGILAQGRGGHPVIAAGVAPNTNGGETPVAFKMNDSKEHIYVPKAGAVGVLVAAGAGGNLTATVEVRRLSDSLVVLKKELTAAQLADGDTVLDLELPDGLDDFTEIGPLDRLVCYITQAGTTPAASAAILGITFWFDDIPLGR